MNVESCYKCYLAKTEILPCDYLAMYEGSCAWRKTVENDLEKLSKGEENLTFPHLKELV